jgi:hypothetical protein
MKPKKSPQENRQRDLFRVELSRIVDPTHGERFEKLDPFPIVGQRRNFLKGAKRSAAAEQPLMGSRTSREVLEGSGFVPEPPP